jgi:vitamin B12 transporter
MTDLRLSTAVRRRMALACAVSAFALMSAGAAFAQSGPAADAGKTDTVTIVGQTLQETLPQELKKYGSDVETTTIEEVRDAGFVDVSQALQMDTPGLFLAPRSGPFSYLDISIQGSRTQDMLFLLDGVRINNRLYSGTVTDTLPASMIEKIEVLKGGQSLFYGTQAGAGVINVVTRGYTDDFNGLVTAGADTNDGYHLDGYVRGKGGPGNYVLYASHDKADGYEPYTQSTPSAFDKKRGYEVDEVGGKYRLALGDNLSFDARYSHVDARLDYPSVKQVAYSQNRRKEDLASLGVDYQANAWASFQVKGYYYKWDSHYTTVRNNLPLGAGQVVTDDNLFWGFDDRGVNAIAKLTPNKGFEYLIGYDYQQYSGEDQVLVILPQKEDVNAVFAQVRTTDDLFTNIHLAAGARYNKTGGAEKTVWNVSGRYDATSWLYLQGLVGTSFILPTAEQLYAQDRDDPLGNPNLKPENVESANISLGGQFEAAGAGFGWEATYFNRNIDSLISSGQFNNPLINLNPATLYPGIAALPAADRDDYFEEGIFFNLPGKVKVKGFELIGRAQLDGGLSFDASYTHSESKQQAANGTNSDIQRIPTDYAKAGVSWSPTGRHWGLDSHILWTGEQRANVTLLNPGSTTTTSAQSVNYGDYVVVDISGHIYLDAAEHHRITVRLENAFDEDYVTRVSSTTGDSNAASSRFLYGNRGVPQTLRVSYSYAF